MLEKKLSQSHRSPRGDCHGNMVIIEMRCIERLFCKEPFMYSSAQFMRDYSLFFSQVRWDNSDSYFSSAPAPGRWLYCNMIFIGRSEGGIDPCFPFKSLTGQVVLCANAPCILSRHRASEDLALQPTYHTATGHGVHTFTTRTVVGDTLHVPAAHL